MFLVKHPAQQAWEGPAHPIKVTEQGKEGGVGTEEPRDFGRWKSTLGLGLGEPSINLQLLILPDTHRAREILHPEQGWWLRWGEWPREEKGQTQGHPGAEEEGRSTDPSCPPSVLHSQEPRKETWMHIPLWPKS